MLLVLCWITLSKTILLLPGLQIVPPPKVSIENVLIMVDLICIDLSSLFIFHVLYPVDISLFELLNKILKEMVEDMGSPFVAALTEDTHVLPDFHGNR